MLYFRVRNFDNLQHYKDRSPKWIKLYNQLLDDYEFGQLPDNSKIHIVLIWLLASRHNNKLPYDEKWIAQRIQASSKIDLNKLKSLCFIEMYQDDTEPYQSGTEVSETASLEKRREEKIREEDSREDTQKMRSTNLTDKEFIEELKNNLGYKNIDIGAELLKMDAWILGQNGRRKKTRKFIINWLNRIDKPMEAEDGKKTSVAAEWAAEQGVNIYENDGEGAGDPGCSFPKLEAHKGEN